MPRHECARRASYLNQGVKMSDDKSEDRQLLELAAKAAGLNVVWKEGHCKGG